jgi:hypothetical protein
VIDAESGRQNLLVNIGLMIGAEECHKVNKVVPRLRLRLPGKQF